MNITEIENKLTPEEETLLHKIANRAHDITQKHQLDVDYFDILMDFTAVHTTCGGLRLKELLEADDTNFMHDFGGIRRHLNRDTVALEGCFVPRFSV